MTVNRKAGREYSADFSKIKTQSVEGRIDLVKAADLLTPSTSDVPEWDDADFMELVDAIVAARRAERPVIAFMGAHVIKCRLSRYFIELIKEGFVTHVAGNGAVSIHDFELAYHGGTSEDVPTAIEDGTFGMWEETGSFMNRAIRGGSRLELGYGEALARWIDRNPSRFPHRGDCLLYQAYVHRVPATYHIAIGTDIIHQHPTADFGAIGKASGVDFRIFCDSVAKMDGGVFMNFGSGVIGPEVFLKAISIARNLGFPTRRITTANFDLRALGDYRAKIGYDDPNYYYRPRKNIVNRPTSSGGRGWHFEVDHAVSVPNLYRLLHSLGEGALR